MASGSNPLSKKKSSSSSSHKKKLSKKSSEVRKRKRSRSRKRDKLKKRSGRGVSVSCSDDDSRTKDSGSDLDDDYRRRKGRSRTRVDGNGGKKKGQRISSVRDDSRDRSVRKKRKESKGDYSSEVKKKDRKKEGSKRGARVDYFSSDSESCSTCRGGSDSEDSGFERSRGRSKGREKNKTRKGRDKNREKNRYRSRSFSSCSDRDEQTHDRSEERLMDENYSRRLKSVLSVPDEYEEEGRYRGKIEHTEEVILAYDECPSSKSNDSYEGERKTEISSQTYPTPENRWEYDGRTDTSYLMDEKDMHSGKKVDDSFTSKSKSTQSEQISKDDVGSQHGKIGHASNMELRERAEDGNVSTGIDSSVASDLESILRQKALENFRKFRGGPQVNTNLGDQKNGNDIDVKQSHESENEPIKTEFSRKADDRVPVAKEALKSGRRTRVEGESFTNPSAHGLKISDGNSKRLDFGNTRHADNRFEVAKDLEALKSGSRTRVEEKSVTKSSEHGLKIPDGNSKRLDSGNTGHANTRVEVAKDVEALKSGSRTRVKGKSVTHGLRISDGNSTRLDSVNTVHADDGVVDGRVTQKKIINLSKIRKSNLDSLVDRRESSGDHSVVKQAFPDGKSKDADTIASKIVPEPPKSADKSFVPHETNEAPGSTSSESKSIATKIIPEPTKAATGSFVPRETNQVPRSTSESNSPVNKILSELPNVAVGISDPSKTDKAPESATSEAAPSQTPVTGEHGSTESSKADDGGSEFQQKTMTVMRGGEMVQVSYKVYIPKKTPALARRQLRR